MPPNDQLIYMIDFGFSKFYIDPNSNRHIEESNAKRDFIGNYWFTSINVHCRGKGASGRSGCGGGDGWLSKLTQLCS